MSPMYTFKCTGKCMTTRDDNDELEGGFRQIHVTIRSTFDKVSKRMSLYEYVHVGVVHKIFFFFFLGRASPASLRCGP